MATESKPKQVTKTIGADGGALTIGDCKILIPKQALHQAYNFCMKPIGAKGFSLSVKSMEIDRKMEAGIDPGGIILHKPAIIFIKKKGKETDIVRGTGSSIETSYDDDAKVLYGPTTQLGDFAIA